MAWPSSTSRTNRRGSGTVLRPWRGTPTLVRWLGGPFGSPRSSPLAQSVVSDQVNESFIDPRDIPFASLSEFPARIRPHLRLRRFHDYRQPFGRCLHDRLGAVRLRVAWVPWSGPPGRHRRRTRCRPDESGRVAVPGDGDHGALRLPWTESCDLHHSYVGNGVRHHGSRVQAQDRIETSIP